jgi:hypothetical protein
MNTTGVPRGWLAAVLLAAGGVGMGAGLSCGGGGAGAATSSDFVASFCALATTCCRTVNPSSDGSQCRAFYGAFASAQRYSPGAGEACLTELRAASGRSDFCPGITTNAPSCQGVFANGGGGGGSRKPGEECSADGDCATSSEGRVRCQSLYVMSAVMKRCQLQVKGKEGDNPCVGTVDGSTTSYFSSNRTEIPTRGFLCYVSDGIRCDSTSGACVKIHQVGEACSGGSNECVKTAYCDTVQRKCAERKPAGSPCTSTTQCTQDASCDLVAKTCVALLADGAACTQSGQCKSRDCVNGRCDPSGTGDFALAIICGTSS